MAIVVTDDSARENATILVGEVFDRKHQILGFFKKYAKQSQKQTPDFEPLITAMKAHIRATAQSSHQAGQFTRPVVDGVCVIVADVVLPFMEATTTLELGMALQACFDLVEGMTWERYGPAARRLKEIAWLK